MIYIELFWAFFKVGILSFGGGYAALPLIQEQIVDVNAWITIEQFADILTISEMTPGPMSLNAATFVGTQLAGVGGALISTLGFILPSCIIVTILALLYKKYHSLSIVSGALSGLRPAVVGFIASAGATLIILALFAGGDISFDNIDFIAVGIFAAAFLSLRFIKRIPPILVLCAAGGLGGLLYGFLG